MTIKFIDVAGWSLEEINEIIICLKSANYITQIHKKKLYFKKVNKE